MTEGRPRPVAARAGPFLPIRQLQTVPGSRVVRFADEDHSDSHGCTRALSKRARNEFDCILSPDVHSFGTTEAMSLLVLRSDGEIDLS
jgi:hypothetical protein